MSRRRRAFGWALLAGGAALELYATARIRCAVRRHVDEFGLRRSMQHHPSRGWRKR